MSIMMIIWLLPFLVATVLLLLAARQAPLFKPRTYAEGAAGLFIASLPFIVVTPFTFYTHIALIVVQLFMIVLAGRIIFGRLDKQFAYRSTQGNIVALLVVTCVIIGLWALGVTFPGLLGGYEWRVVVLLTAALVVGMIFVAQIWWSVRHYRITTDSPHRMLADLPTVSVCIPARNENHALKECLTSVIASAYPKLEVIVLDDCSQDKTSETIRSFAHSGVRFIKGATPADGWLGKNQALQTLSEHASGEYILFMDVDTRLGVTSIPQLVDYILDNKMDMLSVLPQNRLGMQPGAVFGTLRDFWEMVLPLTKRHIAVAGQAWMIQADRLHSLGGFKSVAQKIAPEESFARRLFTHGTYRFIAGNTALGITTAKRWPSELETAVRVLYPTYKRQPVAALLAILGTCALLVLPFGGMFYLIGIGYWSGILTLTVFVCAILLAVHAYVSRRTHPRAWVLRTFLLPILALQEAFLILTSMIQYEFGEVNWKGRNVCYPVISSGRNQPARLAQQSHRSQTEL